MDFLSSPSASSMPDDTYLKDLQEITSHFFEYYDFEGFLPSDIELSYIKYDAFHKALSNYLLSNDLFHNTDDLCDLQQLSFFFGFKIYSFRF